MQIRRRRFDSGLSLKIMKITIIGTGYVGLVTGACLSEVGHNVTCLDIDKARINDLNSGEIPFHEPGLQNIILKSLESQNITFTTSYEEACVNDIYFICVGTPDDGKGKPNLSSLENVLRELSENIKQDSYLFTKSTVPLGTNRLIEHYFSKESNLNSKVYVASNPEFLKEGSAVNDFKRPDRIIVGTDNENIKRIAKDIFKPFNRSKNKMQFMSVESSELTKYASNAFLATKISFMNDIAKLCDTSGANIHDVRLGMGSDPRIGESFLYAGLGYGGSCFPKDVNALISFFEERDIEEPLIKMTKRVNETQLDYFFKKISNEYHDLSNKNFAIWGLTFKPNSDDVRESVAIKLIKKLSPLVENLKIYDPLILEHPKEIKDLTNIEFSKDKYSALDGCNGLIICTEWKEFWEPEVEEFSRMQQQIVFDGRNILNKDKLNSIDIKYHGIGI